MAPAYNQRAETKPKHQCCAGAGTAAMVLNDALSNVQVEPA